MEDSTIDDNIGFILLKSLVRILLSEHRRGNENSCKLLQALQQIGNLGLYHSIGRVWNLRPWE